MGPRQGEQREAGASHPRTEALRSARSAGRRELTTGGRVPPPGSCRLRSRRLRSAGVRFVPVTGRS
jgi:hypothetical protein